MKIVFLDTVGLLGLLNASDQWHSDASAAWEQLQASDCRYSTTPQVLYECGNAMARTGFRTAVSDLRDELSEHGNLLEPTADEVVAAWSAYRHAPQGGPSIVDCLSFEVMRRLGATESFTNDRHFAAAGFTLLF